MSSGSAGGPVRAASRGPQEPGASDEETGEPLTFDQVIAAAGRPGEPVVAEWAG
ncbi:hypothetical protein ACFC58_02235 [Kitasatospora purpeofusca]|uniref:hypothetical protein n=1 Tax=Kitasatospora purpeofusca TaxID=67352 RepID=UPI0035E3752C